MAMTSPPNPQEHRVEIVKARKRSAIISILLVDVPFLAIRGSMYVLELQAAKQFSRTEGEPQSWIDANKTEWRPLNRQHPDCVPNATESELRNAEMSSSQLEPMIHSWMLKNFCCILLQAMMLRFVQQADLERAQKLKWMDAYQSETFALKNVQMHRRKSQNPLLRKLWEEKDDRMKSKMEAAFEDCVTTLSSDDDMATESSVSEPERSLSPSLDASSYGTPRLQTSARSPLRLLLSPCRLCCCCCRRGRCCGGVPSKVRSTILHIIMGFALGWFFNQIPFAEMFRSLANTRCS